MQKVAEEGEIHDTKWGSRFTTAVNTANKHIEELYAGLDTLEKDCNDFMRLLLTDLKRELINVPVQKKQTPAAPGRPLDVMPHQRGEVKRKKRRTPALTPATGTAVATAATKQKAATATGDDEEDSVAKQQQQGPQKKQKVTPAPKRPRKPAREKKTKVLPLPGSVKAEADAGK